MVMDTSDEMRHPQILLGNQWSNGLLDPNIDLLGHAMAYHFDLREILIGLVSIDLTPEVFCFELSLEFIHHILLLDYGEKVSDQFEFCEEPIAVHLFGPKILEPFGLYEEGRGMGEGPVRGIRMDGGGMHLWRERICHDCKVKVGELHQLGCDMERCPICGGQLITCSEEHFELVEQGRYVRIPYIQPINNCAVCGILYPEMFNVPDTEWEKYVTPPLQSEWICRSCYDELKELFPKGWRSIK